MSASRRQTETALRRKTGRESTVTAQDRQTETESRKKAGRQRLHLKDRQRETAPRGKTRTESRQ